MRSAVRHVTERRPVAAQRVIPAHEAAQRVIAAQAGIQGCGRAMFAWVRTGPHGRTASAEALAWSMLLAWARFAVGTVAERRPAAARHSTQTGIQGCGPKSWIRKETNRTTIRPLPDAAVCGPAKSKTWRDRMGRFPASPGFPPARERRRRTWADRAFGFAFRESGTLPGRGRSTAAASRGRTPERSLRSSAAGTRGRAEYGTLAAERVRPVGRHPPIQGDGR